MNPQRLFGDEDLQLLEFPEQGLFELSDEAGAPLTAEVQDGEDDDLIEVESSRALPDSLQREVALLRGQTAEPVQEAAMHSLEEFISERPALVICQRQVQIVTASRSRHGSRVPYDRREEGLLQKEASCGAEGGSGVRSPNRYAPGRCK